MALRLKAEFVNGALRPLEPLDLEEGTVIDVLIEPAPQVAMEYHPAVLVADRLRQEIQTNAVEDSPTDGAKNYRHYLYGHPKAED